MCHRGKGCMVWLALVGGQRRSELDVLMSLALLPLLCGLWWRKGPDFTSLLHGHI